VEDNDWQGFSREIISINVLENTPMGFFEWFYWGEIVRKAASNILQCSCSF
jgi:hypothetical protein